MGRLFQDRRFHLDCRTSCGHWELHWVDQYVKSHIKRKVRGHSLLQKKEQKFKSNWEPKWGLMEEVQDRMWSSCSQHHFETGRKRERNRSDQTVLAVLMCLDARHISQKQLQPTTLNRWRWCCSQHWSWLYFPSVHFSTNITLIVYYVFRVRLN